jgi:hypothetical protein
MSTLTFARSKIVGIECPDENTFLAHGILDDYVYALELDVEVRLPDLELTSVHGRWKRYTTPEWDYAGRCLWRVERVRREKGCSRKGRIPEEEV